MISAAEVALHREGLVTLDFLGFGEVDFEGGEVGVALVGVVDVADEPFVDEWGQGLVDFRAADDEDLAVHFRDGIGAVDDLDAFVRPCFIAGEDDVLPFRQGPADGLEGFPAHEYGVAEGGFLEEREILGEVPREFSVRPDKAVWVHGDDGCEVGHEKWLVPCDPC